MLLPAVLDIKDMTINNLLSLLELKIRSSGGGKQ